MKVWGSKTTQSKKDSGLIQLCDPYSELLIRNIAEAYPFNDVKYIIGKVMRESKGHANPAFVRKIIKEVKGIK